MTVTALEREYPKNTVTIVMTVMQGIRVTVTAIGRGHPKTAVTTVTAVTQAEYDPDNQKDRRTGTAICACYTVCTGATIEGTAGSRENRDEKRTGKWNKNFSKKSENSG